MIVTGLTADPIDVGALVNEIRRPDCGAIVVFEGTTRSPNDDKTVHWLEYEAWEERAERSLRRLADEAAARWGIPGVVAVHRTGLVPIGEASVVVACAAGHRTEAFEAARWLIDSIKSEVEIWKREVFEGGAAWIGINGE